MNLVLLPLKQTVVFPGSTLPFVASDRGCITALKEAIEKDKSLIFMSAKIPAQGHDSVFRVGVIGGIKHVIEFSDNTIKVIIEVIAKGSIQQFTQKHPCQRVLLVPLQEPDTDEDRSAVLLDLRRELSRFLKDEEVLDSVHSPADAIAVISMFAPLPVEILQTCLEQNTEIESLFYILQFLKTQPGSAGPTEGKMFNPDERNEVYQKAAQIITQRNTDKQDEMEDFIGRIKKIKFPDHIKKELEKQVTKLNKLNPEMSEYYTTRNYIEWLLDIPWDKETPSEVDLNKLQAELDKSHYGMEDIKDRILEHMAVQKLNGTLGGSVLCFISPPGCGKTSIAKSIATALDRKFVKISLGGVRDEAEIRGHRKTYVGSMPGKIINALKQAGTMNPVILLDEIDKLSNDAMRGNPSAALLEALDPEQNKDFTDHYINLGVDLSKVLFIATGNDVNTIEHALYDRLEIINMDGYSDREKINIATKYLIPEVYKETNVPVGLVSISDGALQSIVNEYTRESGVRDMKRKLETIFRKVAKSIAMGEKPTKVEVTQKNLIKYLGPEKLSQDKSNMLPMPGLTQGMAWNGMGGDLLPIEITMIPEGEGDFQITGNLGKVMEESVKVALAYLKTNSKKFDIDLKMFKEHDFCVHFPEGAISKDGPSAGVAITTAILSLLKNIKISKQVSFTGEMTINGAVLAVGGIKEKVLAAKRNGVTTIVLPAANEKDIVKMDQKDVRTMTFIYVSRFEDLYPSIQTKLVSNDESLQKVSDS